MSRRRPGNLERRGDSYRVRLCIGGKRHKFTIPTTDRRLAERFAATKARELEEELARKAAGIRTGVTMSELLALFGSQSLPTLSRNTRRTYGDSLKPIRAYFVDVLGDPPVDRLRTADVVAFLSWRRTWRVKGRRKKAPIAPVSNRTLQKDRAVLHAVMALAARMEFAPSNVVARAEPPKADPRSPVILTTDEYDALLRECGGRPMLALYVTLLGETGLRCESEALWLRWEDVDLDQKFLHVVSGRDGHRVKSGRSRFVPMTGRLVAALKEHFAHFYFGGSPWVFHHQTTGRHHRRGERIGTMRVALYAAAKRAKLPAHFRPHDLRHRRVTTWLADGQNPVHVKEAMGHSDLRVTMGYTHLAKEHLRALVEERPLSTLRPTSLPATAR